MIELRKFVPIAGADAVRNAEGNTEAPMNGLARRSRRSLRAGHAGTRGSPGTWETLPSPSIEPSRGELDDQVPLASRAVCSAPGGSEAPSAGTVPVERRRRSSRGRTGLATKQHQNRKYTYTRLSNMAAAKTGSDFENGVFSIMIVIMQ